MNILEIDVLKHGTVEAIGLKGKLVLGDPVNDLRRKMENLIAHEEYQFVLDLEGVSMMDSSGIGLIVLMLTTTKEAGGSVKLVKPSKQVTQTLKMCSVLPLFEVYADNQEAIASFER